MSILEELTTGPVSKSRKTLLYGPHGIGKSTWASKWPNPVFVCTEDGSKDLDVTRTKLLTETTQVAQAIKEIHGSKFDTLVLDSVDWLEKLIQRDLDKEGFQDAFGRGTVEINRRVGSILRMLDEVVKAGKHVVILGHAEIKTVTRPDGASWSQYTPKLTKQAVASVSEWVDELLFANNVIRTQNKEVGFKSVAVGIDSGKRIVYTEGSATFQAKHRKASLKPFYELADVSTYLSDLN